MDSNITAIINTANAVQGELNLRDNMIADLNAQIVALKSQPSHFPAPTPGLPYTQYSLQIQSQPGWIQPGNTGDSGGGDPTKPNGTFSMTPGDVATFSAKGGYSYNNGYFFKDLGSFPAAKLFMLTAEVLIVDTSVAQAIEFVVEKCVNGTVYDMEWQHPLGDYAAAGNHVWRVFNRASGSHWEPTSIPISMKSNQWMKITAEFAIAPDNSKFAHTTFTVDGNKTTLSGITHSSAPNSWPVDANYLHVAFQLDTNGKTPPTSYTCQMRNCNLYWG